MKFKIAAILSTVVLISITFCAFETSVQAVEARFVYQFDEDGKHGPPGPKCLLGDVNL